MSWNKLILLLLIQVEYFWFCFILLVVCPLPWCDPLLLSGFYRGEGGISKATITLTL